MLVTIIISTSVVNATNTNNTQTDNTQNIETSINQENNIITNDNEIQETITQNKTQKINKKTATNTKTATETTVYNATQLEQAISQGTNIINMAENEESDYHITRLFSNIEYADMTINGNGITIYGNDSVHSTYQDTFLAIGYKNTITIRDVIFENFTQTKSIISIQDEETVVNIINCTFKNNREGYIIGITYDSTVKIINSTFVNNTPNNMGIIYYSVTRGSYTINASNFTNNHILGNLYGVINVPSNLPINLVNLQFENNTRANFIVEQNETTGQYYIKLDQKDNYLINIMNCKLYIDDEDTPRYNGTSIETYKFDDYNTLRLVVTGVFNDRWYNLTYLFKSSKPQPKTYTVHNYDELARAVDEAKTVNETDIIITLVPGGDYNATTSMIFGPRYHNGTVLNDAKPKKLTINGNSTILDGKEFYQFMSIDENYKLNIENITINNYNAIEGGALYIDDLSEVYINNVTFNNNTAEYGGAIYAFGDPNINNSVFNNNTAKLGGSIYKYGATWYNITNSNFTDNTPDKFEIIKDGEKFLLNMSNLYYTVYNPEIEIFENGVSKGLYYPEYITGGIIQGYTVPIGKIELSLKVNTNEPHVYSNNIYNILVNIQEYNVETKIINDTLNNVLINVTVKDETGEAIKQQDVNMTLPDGTTLTEKTDDNGNATFKPDLPIGINTVEIIINGTENYTEYQGAILVEVEAIPTNTQIEEINNTVTNTTIKVTVTDINEEVLDDGIIIIKDENNKTITRGFIQNKEAIIQLDLPAGTHEITAVYQGNTTHLTSNNTKTIKILHQAEIQVEILNVTEGNVQAKITVHNEEGTPITEEINIELPNGTTTQDKPDNTGKLEVTDPTVTPGEKTITVTVPDTEDTMGATLVTPLTVLPDYQKIIDEMNETINKQNETINDLNETVNKQNDTIHDMNDTINELNDTVNRQNQTINDLNDTVNKLNDTIHDMNDTINDLNDTVNRQNQTINDLNDTVNKLNNTIQEMNKTINELNETNKNLTKQLETANDKIKELNNTINDLNKEIQTKDKQIENLTKKLETANDKIENLTKELQDADNKIDNLTGQLETANKTINNLEEQLKTLQDKIDKMNKTSVIRAIPENTTIGESKVTVTLDNQLETPITNAPITIKNKEGKTIGTGTTDKNGIAIIPVNTTAGTETITVTYPGNNKYTPATTTTTITTTKNKVTIILTPVIGIIGENITITAKLIDENGNPVNGGNIIFKLNGKTLRSDGRIDTNATPYKITVVNGTAQVSIKADKILRNVKNFTASYSGNYKYEETKSETVKMEIRKRNAQITVTANPSSQKQYNKITFKATLKDITPGYKNTTSIYTDTQVIFKINGKTIKDKNGKEIKVKVNKDATATYTYTIPAGMGGVTKEGDIRFYTIEAVLVSDTYYPDTRNTGLFNVKRSPTTINIEKVTVNKKNQLSIKATILDYKQNKVIGSNDINIKINGKSYVNPKSGKTQNFKVTDGIINLSDLQVSTNITIKNITIVTGDRQAYLGQRNETAKITKT